MQRLFSALLLLTAMALSACSPAGKLPPLVGTDITGADFAQTLSLIDHTGAPRQLADYKGKVIALFFGYTHCPDVCPTTMLEMAKAMKLLGKQADGVQVLFVTLDPERDTQDVLAKFVPSFDSRFVGLYGTAEQTAETAKNFKIFYAKQQEAGKSGYTIDHSAGVYVFDKKGKIRIYLKYGQKPEEIASDLQHLL
ncbi:MAG: SCO family protein [Methylophilaceae bacterium]